MTEDSLYTEEHVLRSVNEPGTFEGKPAMHYVEMMNKTADNCPASYYCPDSHHVWDVYYDKDTGLDLGGAGYEVGTGDRWNIPPGTPLNETDGFYTNERKGYLEPNMLMGSSYILPADQMIAFSGNETITVPAGTFSRASHFISEETNCYSVCTKATKQYWTVPGIPGFVKIQYDLDGPDEMYPLIHSHARDETLLTGWG